MRWKISAIDAVIKSVDAELAKGARSVDDAAQEVADVLYDIVPFVGDGQGKDAFCESLESGTLRRALVECVIKTPLNFKRKFLATFRELHAGRFPELSAESFPELYRAVADAMVPDNNKKQLERTNALERHVRTAFQKHLCDSAMMPAFLERVSIASAAVPVLESLADMPDDAELVRDLFWEFMSEVVYSATEEIARIYTHEQNGASVPGGED